MKLLFFWINTIISIVLGGVCRDPQNEEKTDPFILAVIESNSLCMILQFLMLSDYELFFFKYEKIAF